MQLAAPRSIPAPTASTPARPALGELTLGAWSPDGGYWVDHTVVLREDATESKVRLGEGTSLRDAITAAARLAAASTSPAGSPLQRAYAVLEAERGVYELAPLEFRYDGRSHPAFVDGALAQEWGVGRVRVARDVASFKALVGATSWVDLSSSPSGSPRPLPGSPA